MIGGNFSQISIFGEESDNVIRKSRNETFNDYDEFTEKFKPKLTTDDCYTPPIIYDAISGWVEEEYCVNRSQFVRPFYPGGDYQRFNYPEGCVVVDNPPFSILSEIRRFYYENNIKYFLFGPALTIFGGSVKDTAICAGAPITYENGAVVNTSFVTNLEDEGVLLRSAPDLCEIVSNADDQNRATFRKQQPKYKYPPQVVTAAMINYLSIHGVEYRIERSQSFKVPGGVLDAQRTQGKSLFGGGYFISEKAAAEKAAAEKAAAEKAAAEKAAAIEWQLSDREKEIIRRLGDCSD